MQSRAQHLISKTPPVYNSQHHRSGGVTTHDGRGWGFVPLHEPRFPPVAYFMVVAMTPARSRRIAYQRWLRIVYTRHGTGGLLYDWWESSPTPTDDDRVYAREAGYLLHDHPRATVLRVDVVRVRTLDGVVIGAPREDPDIIGRYVPGPHVHPIDPYPHLTAGV